MMVLPLAVPSTLLFSLGSMYDSRAVAKMTKQCYI